MAFLSQIQTFSKNNLKQVETETYHLNGKRFIRKAGETNENETDIIKIYPDEEGFIENRNSIPNSADSSAYWSRCNGYVVDIVPDYTVDQIIDRLFISGEDPAGDKMILDQHKITHILNLTTNVRNKFESDIIYKQIKINDLPSVKIDCHFAEAFNFLDNVLKLENNSVLVHCHAGVSRSSSFIIGYLLHKRFFRSYQEAHDFVKQKRPMIRPNDGFVKQLRKLED